MADGQFMTDADESLRRERDALRQIYGSLSQALPSSPPPASRASADDNTVRRVRHAQQNLRTALRNDDHKGMVAAHDATVTALRGSPWLSRYMEDARAFVAEWERSKKTSGARRPYADVRTPPKPKPAGQPETPRESATKKKHRDD